jgi:acyl transferase domain-containing protein
MPIVSAADARQNRPAIAVTGLACRFPGAADEHAFWRLLIEGREAIGPMPTGRFDRARFDDTRPGEPGQVATRQGGFLEDVDRFDAAFFGISPREAAVMDPQHRLLLETAWNAIEDAGLTRQQLAGSNTGVFVGLWTNDYERLVAPAAGVDVDVFGATGTGRYAAAGRLSYAFDLRGPSLSVDTACSSSLVAIHLACQSLRAGDCDLALVGGVNLILDPLISIAYSRSGLLSREGRCRFGNAEASGYVRSEGVGVIVLRREADAQARGDRLRSVIVGSAINNDGRASGSIVAPSASAQAAMMRDAYRSAGVDPRDVAYIEAHGTGTRVGDPAEVAAIGELIGNDRADACLVGSVKTNIGHTEAAAGMAGLIKVILALEHGIVPASLHVGQLNPHIDWTGTGLRLCLQPTAIARDGSAVAGVNSFGITGTNAHVVVRQATASRQLDERDGTESRDQLVPLSASVEDSLAALIERWRAHDWSDTTFADAAYTAAVHRTHHQRRRAVVARGFEDLMATLGTPAVRQRPAEGVPSVVFVFPGQGSQWVGMARQLLATEPEARRALEACDGALTSVWEHSALELIARADASDLEDVAIVQPLLFAVQVMLARVWMSWGVRPSACIGHSLGEVAAAHIAGALTLEDAARVICARSALLARKRGQGAMALVEATAFEAERLVEPFTGVVSVAAINDHRSVVLSGSPPAVKELIRSLEDAGRFCRRVSVDVASHSPDMDDLVSPLEQALTGLEPAQGEYRLYSTVTGDLSTTPLDAEYWGRNLRQPVRFAAACEASLRDGHRAFVEISPHPILTHSIGEILGDRSIDATVVGSLRREENEKAALLRSAGELYEAGIDIDWSALYPTHRRVVALPAYPWCGERYWIDNRSLAITPAGGAMERVSATRPPSVFEIEWSEIPLGPPSATPAPTILVVGDQPASRELTAAAERGGIRALTPSPDDLSGGVDWPPYVERANGSLVVVFVAPTASILLDARWSDVEQALTEQLVSFTKVVRALSDTDSPDVSLWVVTERGDAASATASIAPVAASVLALARVVWEEHPELAGGTIDLESSIDADAAEAVLAHVLSATPARQIALRNGQRLSPRLVPSARAAAPLQVRADATYLISGGLGGVGLVAANRLVERGARHVVLVGRRGLPDRDKWDRVETASEVGERIAAVLELERRGATVETIEANVADREALHAVLGRVEADGGRIAGVIHAAATVNGSLIERVTVADFIAEARPKVAGAWHLLQYFEHRSLDFLICCSSIGALVGLTGQASYAASNAFVDALAHAVRNRGGTATSINWGGWHEVGLARSAGGARAHHDLTEDGLAGFDREQGLDALEQIASTHLTQAVVLSIDIDKLARSPRMAASPELFRALITSAATSIERDIQSASLRRRLLELSPPNRRIALSRALKGELSRILRLPETSIGDRTPVGTLGLESLMGLELHRWLERSLAERLPKTVVWRHPTVDALCEFLLTRLEADAITRPTSSVPPPVPQIVEAISERDALAVLLNEDGGQ